MLKNIKKSSHKLLAATLMITILTVAVQYSPSQFQTAQAYTVKAWGAWSDKVYTPTPIALPGTITSGNHVAKNTLRTSDGIITLWTKSDGNIWAQKYNASNTSPGTAQWGVDGIQITSFTGTEPSLFYTAEGLPLVTDNVNGVFVGYSNVDGATRDVYITRVTSNGAIACTTGPIYKDTNQAEYMIRISPDGQGGIYAAWHQDTSIFVSRFNANCEQTWNQAQQITKYNNEKMSHPNIATATDGVYVSAFEDESPSISSRGTIRLMKFDANGNIPAAWAGGRTIRATSISSYTATHPLITDNQGGVMLAYSLASTYDLFATRFDSEGVRTWGTAPLYEISLGKNYSNAAQLGGISDGNNGMIIAWDGYNANYKFNAHLQRLDSNGNKLWNNGNRVEINYPADEITNHNAKYNIAADGNGGAYLMTTLSSNFQTQIHYINNSGVLKPRITPTGRTSSYLLDQTDSITSDGINGAFITYQTNSGKVNIEYLGQKITSITPSSAPKTGGTPITIKGYAFASHNIRVYFGGNTNNVCNNVVVVNSTTIQCTTPAGQTAGATTLTVRTELQYSLEYDTVPFTFTEPAPIVSSIDPTNGPAEGGTNVTITGTNFVNGATVTIGTQNCTNTNFVSSTSLTCTTAAHTQGTYDVKVTNPDGQIGTLPNAFTYDTPPCDPNNLNPNEQCATLYISSDRQIYYNGYDNGPAGFNFHGRQASAFTQNTTSNYANDDIWAAPVADRFIGVIDLGTDTAWDLSVTAPPNGLVGSNGGNIPVNNGQMKIATSAHGLGTSFTLTDKNNKTFLMTKRDSNTLINDVYFHELTGYSFVDGVITAALNLDNTIGANFSNYENYETSLSNAPTVILQKTAATQINGIVGIGVSYALEIAAGTPADIYEGTITYTLN
jgi:hypothetical protein